MSKRIDCFYGGSGTGKSEGIVAVMKMMWEQEGLASRAIVGDGSRATYEDSGLIDAGIVEVCDFSNRPWPSTTLARLCEGYWPVDVNDPNSALKAPTLASLAKLGVVAIEGVSVGSQYLMGDNKGGLSEQSGRGIKIGQDSPITLEDAIRDEKTGKIIDGPRDEKGAIIISAFGGNPVAHYGYTQRRIAANIERSKTFPNWVIWTGHERSTQDKVSGEKIIGVEAAGEAMTANLQRVFNNTLHFVGAARKKTKAKDDHTEAMVTELDMEYRVYTRDHFQPDGANFVRYKAVTRGVSAKDMPDYFTDDVPGLSVLRYYRKLAELRKARAAALKGEEAA